MYVITLICIKLTATKNYHSIHGGVEMLNAQTHGASFLATLRATVAEVESSSTLIYNCCTQQIAS